MQGRLDAVVVGVGSGGTLTGLSRYFERTAPDVELVLADLRGSILADYVRTGVIGAAGSWLVEGIGEDFIPSIADLSRVRRAFTIPDEESLRTARALLDREGSLAGSSSGTLVAAALRYCRESDLPRRVVTFICDSGNKYLSKMYNDYWMRDQGFLRGEPRGNLRDLISRSHENGSVVAVSPHDTLLMAHGKMKLFDVSQLPVLEHDRIVGILDESDLLVAATRDTQAFKLPVCGFMSSRLTTVTAETPLQDLLPKFDRGMVAIVVEGERIMGLVTRIDVLNALRRRLSSARARSGSSRRYGAERWFGICLRPDCIRGALAARRRKPVELGAPSGSLLPRAGREPRVERNAS